MLRKKVLAVMLATALVATSAHYYPGEKTIVKGADFDLTGVSVDVQTLNANSNAEQSALESTSYTIGEVAYNDLTEYKGTSIQASSQLQKASYAFDGDLSTRWETNHGSDNEYVSLDFGNEYAVKALLVKWEAASGKEYNVQVSKDGSTYENVTTVTSNSQARIDRIVFDNEIQGVRSVRLKCNQRTTTYGYSIFEMGVYSSEAQKAVIPAISGLKVYDYSAYTGKYMIYFKDDENAEKYNVYIDGSYVKQISSAGYYFTAKELKSYSVGNHILSVSSVNEDGTEGPKATTTFNITGDEGSYTDMPQVYIYSDTSITQDYHDDADVTISVIDVAKGEKDVIDSQCNIKIRGNSTAGFIKKPWNIKLNKKKGLLGMGSGKKWCLLANAFDRSCMRNKLSYDFGTDIGVEYTSDSRYVEVYVNGVYNGNYQLTEPVEAKTNRVEIDAYNADNNDILLELGTRNEAGVDHFTTDVLYTTFDVNEPEKGDDLTDQEVDAKIARVKTYLNGFETALKKQNYDEILNYIDEDTFVNFYIANELFKNQDFNFSSTRFYIKEGKLYAGPMWDLDLSSGNVKTSYYGEAARATSGFKCTEMNWYKYLLRNAVFSEKVKQRYEELQFKIQNIYKNGSTASNSIDQLLAQYGRSFRSNFAPTAQLGAGWKLTTDDGYSYSGESGWTNYDQPVEYLRNWLQGRNEWLCSQWGIDAESAYKEYADVMEVEGQTIVSQTGMEVQFSWGQSGIQLVNGQQYNVYIDGEYYNTYATAQTVSYTFAAAGHHEIKITAVKGEDETVGVVLTVDIEDTTSSTEITTTVKETTTVVPTTEFITKQEQTTPSKAVVSKNEMVMNAKLKVSQIGAKAIIKWGKVKEADGYEVYGAYCGPRKAVKLKTIKSGTTVKATISRLNGKKLNLTKNYKFYVVAYKNIDGKKVKLGKSITAHIVGAKNKVNTNVKGIKLGKSKYTIKKGNTVRIKAKTILVDSSKKPLSNAHAKEFRYQSANKAIATVSSKGVITGKSKGTTKIYVYARNGYAKAVTVTVK